MERFNKGFFSDLAERTIATFAQALIAVLSGMGFGLLEVDWLAAFSVAGFAALLAILKGFAGDLASAESGASWGTTVPKGQVAATEDADIEGKYESSVAGPVDVGTPVDVIPVTEQMPGEDNENSRELYSSDLDHIEPPR